MLVSGKHQGKCFKVILCSPVSQMTIYLKKNRIVLVRAYEIWKFQFSLAEL